MDLKIIKPGESGRGILIEYDAGYISPKSEQNSYILESANTLDHSKPFEFYAVLQKYNTPNRNGRIYPERILKREADNYKKLIQIQEYLHLDKLAQRQLHLFIVRHLHIRQLQVSVELQVEHL